MPQDPSITAHETETIRLMEETARVETRLVERERVRVRVSTDEHDETIETLLMRQDVVVDRVSRGHDVSEAPQVRQDGNIIIVPILEERVVVTRQLVLKEELHIRIDVTRTATPHTVRLKREHATIERDDPAHPKP